MHIHLKKNQGFTIIETLIAVALLMIAIAGPMVVATQALTAAVTSRNTFIATNLAQEGMELLKNVKDNNINVQNTWLTHIDSANNNSTAAPGLGGGGGTCVRSTSASQVECATPDLASLDSVVNGVVALGSCSVSCDATNWGKLYLGPNGYQTDSSGNATTTPFRRYFYISPIGSSTLPNTYDQDEAVFTVAVAWNQSGVPNQITVQELMTDSVR